MILRQLSLGLLELLYPPRCLICAAVPDGLLSPFCSRCDGALRHDRSLRCPRCALVVGPYSVREDACVDCRASRQTFDRTVCLGAYSGPLKRAVLNLKHTSGEGLGELLGRRLGAAYRRHPSPAALDAVVPVPQHWWRRLLRGYNQAVPVARGAAEELGVPLRLGWLHRIRATVPQKPLGKAERWENLRGAFRARSAVAGRHVLLVDDIMTSQATAHEAAGALRRAGASRVTVAILARTSFGTGPGVGVAADLTV